MKSLLALLVVTVSLQQSYAQTNIEDKLGAWYTLDATHIVSEKTSFTTGIQLRAYEATDNINLIFYYAGINYKITPKIAVSVGGYYIDVDKSIDVCGTPHLYEKTIFEQISYNHTLGKFPIYHKLRMENRFLIFMGETTPSNRLRYCVGTKIALNKLLYLNANNEFFANLKGDVCTENRLFGALGINITKANSVQIGYMNHKINGLNLHRLQLMLLIKTDLRKKTPISS
ncbi:DUF2490 domain-containing protein [Mariniflexile maritimum]|uniref:DUF2490 domain-containing protein n=1 Tax=Mariniflexile maritimum TaxID=2682493 RepID=UPI0012F66C07|nr:DUF2490 domain-containing protein [Mariniflexile maritimum]